MSPGQNKRIPTYTKIYNVRDAAYGAKGDGETGAPAGGGVESGRLLGVHPPGGLLSPNFPARRNLVHCTLCAAPADDTAAVLKALAAASAAANLLSTVPCGYKNARRCPVS